MSRPIPEWHGYVRKNPQLSAQIIAKRFGIKATTVYGFHQRIKSEGIVVTQRRAKPARQESARIIAVKIPLGEAMMRALRQEAEKRGEPVEGLMARLLETIAADRMVAAILDDGVA